MQFLIANINDFDDSELETVMSRMPKNQREYINRKKRNTLRKQSIVARVLIKNLLTKFYEVSDGYSIDFDSNGKPYYLNSNDLHISLSHSGDFVCAVVSNKPVGIDIQIHKTISDKLIKRVCTDDEYEFIKSSDNNAFFRIWTAKEAYSKCTGLKLSDAFKLSFVRNGSVCGLDKMLYFCCEDNYMLSIIE